MAEKRKDGQSALVKEARKRFKRCQDWEATARKRFIEDTKFANGDARNHYQWPEEQRKSRDADAKPCMTINKTRQHNLQIVNDARQNKMAVKVSPVGGGASFDSAQVYSSLIRHIEYQSNATRIYTAAVRNQVEGGFGYWRIVTEYADTDSFDQEIFIRRVRDPLCVYVDPDCKELDRADARFAFIFEEMDLDEAEKKWPDLKGRFAKNALTPDDISGGWADATPGKEKVRVAEYFQRNESQDELVAVAIPPNNDRVVKRLSELAKHPQLEQYKSGDLHKALEGMGAQFRTMTDHSVKWSKIVGDTVVEEGDWAGKYIPVVMLCGEETVIDGEMDRKGHTRAMLDPQMNYNFWTSEATTQVALQSKAPWLVDLRAIEGVENYWDTANRKSWPYLPYNSVTADDGATPIDRPTRPDPPVMAQAYIQGMQIAAEELRMVSGQYQAVMGAAGNETSGVAIQQRQRQADNATYHYVDNLGDAIHFTGKILIDLIPKIYDTKRVIQIRAENGDITEVTLDPQHAQAYFEQQQTEAEQDRAIFNPNVGKYSVEADVGPSFATQRQEAFNAISQIVQQNKELAVIVGDLLFKAADFPLANDIAERLRRMVPPQALGEGPDPQVQALMGQNQQLKAMIQSLSDKLAESKRGQDSKDDRTMIDAYRAETDRIDVLKEGLEQDRSAFMSLVRRTVFEALGLDPNQAMASLTQAPPEPMPQMIPQQPPPGGVSMPAGQ